MLFVPGSEVVYCGVWCGSVVVYVVLCLSFSFVVVCCGVVGFLAQQCPHLPRITQIICPPTYLSLKSREEFFSKVTSVTQISKLKMV